MTKRHRHRKHPAGRPATGLAGPSDRALTRSQVAATLATSVASVRRMEGKDLHPAKGVGGVRLFAREEVEALASSLRRTKKGRARASLDDGEVAARAFELFDEGRDPADVVMQIRQHPDVIWGLYEKWKRMGGLTPDIHGGFVTRRGEVVPVWGNPPPDR